MATTSASARLQFRWTFYMSRVYNTVLFFRISPSCTQTPRRCLQSPAQLIWLLRFIDPPLKLTITALLEFSIRQLVSILAGPKQILIVQRRLTVSLI